MDEQYLEPDFDHWSFDNQYVEEEWRSLAAWTYDNDDRFEDDLRVRVTAERDGFVFIPPYQLFGTEFETYPDPEPAYMEAIDFIEDLDVEEISDDSNMKTGESS